MNILKRICSISLAAILVMGIASFPANAQFKGLGNKLKSKAEKVVKDKVDKKKKKAEEAVENAVCYQLDIWESIPDSLNPIVATEDFNQYASSSYPSGGITDVSNKLDDYMQLKGWTGEEIYEAGGYARLGYYRTYRRLQQEIDHSNKDG